MIPPTKNKLPTMASLSAMQKCIRRGLELDAMRFAVELHQTRKPFATIVTNRLEIISHEDIDTLMVPWIFSYVRSACEQARTWYDPKKLGKSRMAIGNCIRLSIRGDTANCSASSLSSAVAHRAKARRAHATCD